MSQQNNLSKNKATRKKKKNTSSPLVYFLAIFGVLFLICLFGLRSCLRSEKNDGTFESYKAFGIQVPKGYDVHGIDVSYFQGNVPMQKLKNASDNDANISFVYIKATEGITRQDKRFAQNFANAKKAGLVRGAYHYFISSRNGKEQAENFIQHVQLESGDLPPVIDIERVHHTTPEEMQKEVMDWIQTVQAHYGVKPIIYTFVSFYRDYLGSKFDEYPLWIAHYQKHTLPRINRSWLIWQHDEKGKIKGLKGNYDFNVFNGDSTDFENILIP